MILKTSTRNWTVYILQAKNGFYYTGITTDLKRRFREHRETRKGAKFFRTTEPEKVVYQKSNLTHSQALRHEREIKKLSRAEKAELALKCVKIEST